MNVLDFTTTYTVWKEKKRKINSYGIDGFSGVQVSVTTKTWNK